VSHLPARVTKPICLGYPKVVTVGKGHRLTCPVSGCDASERAPGARLIGRAFSLGYTTAKCVCNSLNALVTRHLKSAPEFTGNFDFAREWFQAFLPRLYHMYWADLCHHLDKWLEKWPQKKRQMFLKSQLEDDLALNVVKTFLKKEVTIKLSPVPVDYVAFFVGSVCLEKARAIQTYLNLYSQMYSGPNFYCLQKSFANALLNYSYMGIDAVMASGMNAQGIARWMERRMHLKFLESDGKNWDSTMMRQHHEMKYFIYDFVDPFVGNAARKSAKVKGSIRTRHNFIKYYAKYTTKSGHNDTSLGNTIVNIAIGVSLLMHFGLSGSVLAMGDDQLVAFKGDLQPQQCTDYIRTFGIEPELNVFDSWQDVTFISGRFYPSKTGLLFAPRVSSILDKLFWTVRPVLDKKEEHFRAGIVKCVKCVMNDFPIVGPFLDVHAREINRKVYAEADISSPDSYKFRYIFDSPTPASNQLLLDYICCKHDVGPWEVRDLEKQIRESNQYDILTHPTLTRIRNDERADTKDRRMNPWCRDAPRSVVY